VTSWRLPLPLGARVPPILFFHQIVERARPEHYFLGQALTPVQFRGAMEHVRRAHRVIGIDELERGWQDGRRWPAGAVVLSFDDGFRNNLIAAEILRELGLTATFFVLSEVLAGDFVPWYMRFAHIVTTRRRQVGLTRALGTVDFKSSLSRRRWLKRTKEHLLALAPAARDVCLAELAESLDATAYDPTDVDVQYLRPDDVRRLRALGMSIGSHGATHDNLVRCSDAELEHELAGSARTLGACIDAEVGYVSYPDGRCDERVVAAARRSYRMGFAATPFETDDDTHRIPRRNTGADVAKTLSPGYTMERWVKDAVKHVLAM
jgi:peptidoglycan/xylan/chitin deacetylase (PgdA/CDA1 family)